MTKAYRLLAALVVALVTLSLTSCDTDTPNPQKEITVGYDLWVPLSGASGQSTSNKDAHIIARVADLTKGVLSIKGEGVETPESLTPNVVYHKGYYYNVSREGRFGKFRVSNTGVETIKEIPMKQILDRRFSHAWLDDNTLVMVSSAGDKQKVSWVKVDVNKMAIVAEGKLNLPKPAEGEIFNSSGLLGYRKADNTLIYPHVYMVQSKKDKMAQPLRRNEIYIAFIDASTMEVKKIDKDTRCEHLSSTSFGETRCQKTFFDSKGNFYFAAATCKIPENADMKSSTKQRSFLFRVNAGAMETDKSFDGYAQPRGKIITVFPLNDDEVLLYMQDPDFKEKGNTDWSSKTNRYIYYWLRCNMKTQQVEHIKDIPFSNGNFGQLVVRNGYLVSIGANVEGAPTAIYQYNVNTRKVTKGATLADGFEIDRIMPVVKE